MTNDEFMMKCIDCVNLRNIRTMKSTDRYWMQSMCYIEPENALVICYKQLRTSFSSIEKVNKSDMSRIMVKRDLDYGHVNDITYNSKTNKLYLTPMFEKNSGMDRNVIYELNSSTFVKEREIHIGTITTASIDAITYNSESDQYYVAIGYDIVVLNNMFEIVTRFSFWQDGVNSFGNKFQNLEYYDGKIFLSYWEKIVVFDDKGTYLKNFSTGGSVELEGLASLGDGEFVLGKVYGKTMYMNKIETCTNELWSFNILDCRNVMNLISTEVEAEIESPAKIFNDFNYVQKRGNVVQCSICITNITSVGNTVVATLLPGYRPNHYIRVMGACSGNNFARFEIATDGKIRITATSLTSIQSSYWFELEVTYLVD